MVKNDGDLRAGNPGQRKDRDLSMRTFGVTATSVSAALIFLTFMQILLYYAFSNPLKRAIEWGDAKAVEEILAKGRDPNEKIGGLTTLTYTILECLHTPSWVLRHKYKETYGEKIDADVRKMMDIIDVLVGKGANANELDDRGQAILHYAISRFIYVERRAEVAERLVEKGADVNLRNSRGETALHMAVAEDWCDLETIRFLVENGADVHVKDRRGRTPLSIALRAERQDVAEFLRQRGAEE
jgi:ankyrin repeat protein